MSRGVWGQLLFGNEGTGKSKKTRKPSGGTRQLRAEFDPNRKGKGPSPPSMFMPQHQVIQPLPHHA